MKRVAIIVLGLCSALFFFPIRSFSQDTGPSAMEGIGIVPATPGEDPRTSAWFIYELEPGASVQDEAAVINLFNDSSRVKLYPVDATTTKDGAFALEEESSGKDDVGAWVELDRDEIKLAPQERGRVGFTLTVPETAEPGDHLGGIIAQKVATDSARSGINITARTGARIYLTVPGEISRILTLKDVELEKTEAGPVFNLTLGNEGNSRIEGFQVAISLKNAWWFGPDRQEVTPKNSVIFPGKQITVSIPWEGGLDVLGNYTAEITVTYPDGEPLRETVTFSRIRKKRAVLFAGTVGVGLVFILIVLITFKRLLGRIFRRGSKSVEQPRPEPSPVPYPGRAGPAGAYSDDKDLSQEDYEIQRRISKRVETHLSPEVKDELIFEIRKIVREELELARMSDEIRSERSGRNYTFSPSKKKQKRSKKRFFKKDE